MFKKEISIFKKLMELYRTCHIWRSHVSKGDKYTIWQKCENLLLKIIELVWLANESRREEKLEYLQKTSRQLNLLRIFFRIAKEVKTIDLEKYIKIEKQIDEIGRMLGGWIKSSQKKKDNNQQNTLL